MQDSFWTQQVEWRSTRRRRRFRGHLMVGGSHQLPLGSIEGVLRGNDPRRMIPRLIPSRLWPQCLREAQATELHPRDLQLAAVLLTSRFDQQPAPPRLSPLAQRSTTTPASCNRAHPPRTARQSESSSPIFPPALQPPAVHPSHLDGSTQRPDHGNVRKALRI
jgi:hypothetical protein